MPAPWKRISPQMPPAGQIQAVAAKKHVTIFVRSPSAPGAGTPQIKAAFSECAKTTGGVANRQQRNATMQSCMKGRGLKTGVYKKKSKSKYAPLAGTVYEKHAAS